MSLRQHLGVPSVDAFFAGIGAEVATALPEDVQVTFELDGDGGGTWTVARTGKGVEIRPGRAAWADSVLACSVGRFVDLVTGRADPMEAFADGSLRIEGDLGLLLRLREALPAAA
jgi:putative sterol carrier protein